jgi:hypothetical protein
LFAETDFVCFGANREVEFSAFFIRTPAGSRLHGLVEHWIADGFRYDCFHLANETQSGTILTRDELFSMRWAGRKTSEPTAANC